MLEYIDPKTFQIGYDDGYKKGKETIEAKYVNVNDYIRGKYDARKKIKSKLREFYEEQYKIIEQIGLEGGRMNAEDVLDGLWEKFHLQSDYKDFNDL